MFAYLKGILTAADAASAIVEVHGVGYRLLVPIRSAAALPAVGQPIQLYTTFVIREDAHTLYGFLSSQERDIFEALMNIAGIGPKLALSLIGHLAFHEMQAAIERQDLATLCRVPGVGKKTAERLIVELKDRLPALASLGPAAGFSASPADRNFQHVQDAMLALVHLGYSQHMAQKAIKQSLKELPENSDLALLITTALKNV